MKITLYCGVLFAITCQAQIYPRLECDGSSYTNCTVQAENPAQAIIRYDGGGAFVKTALLPKNVQDALHYDPQKAQAYLDGLAAKRQLIMQNQEIYSRNAKEQWKATHCRMVDGNLVAIADMESFDAEIAGISTDGIIIQTYVPDRSVHHFYPPAITTQNQAVGGYVGPAPSRHLEKAKKILGAKYLVINFKGGADMIGRRLVINAVKTMKHKNGLMELDYGTPYVPN